jgi:hypothetical protein
MTLQEKLNIVQKMVANPNSMCSGVCIFYTVFRWSIVTCVVFIFLSIEVKNSSGVATAFPCCLNNIHVYYIYIYI